MESDVHDVTDEEAAAIAVAVALMWEPQVRVSKIREVWPEPSPWRWAQASNQGR